MSTLPNAHGAPLQPVESAQPPVTDALADVRRTDTRSDRRSYFGPNLVHVLGWFLWMSAVACVADQTYWIVSANPSGAAQVVQGALGGLFLSLLFGAVVGSVVGMIWAVSIGRQHGAELLRQASRRAVAWCLHGTREEHVERVGSLYAVVGLLTLLGSISYLVTRELVVIIARPANVAGTVLLLHAGLVLGGWLLWRFFKKVSTGAVRLVARVPGLSWCVARTARQLTLLILLGLALVVAWAWWQRAILPYLPWREVIVACSAVILGSCLWWLYQRFGPQRRLPRLLARSLTATGVLVSAACAAWIPPYSTTAHDAMVGQVATGRLGMLPIRFLLDWDRDGRTLGFGGGDCSNLNADIHPGAVDIPDNGIDENCDGRDLAMSDLVSVAGASALPRPSGWPQHPPLILITVDALSAEFLGSYGASRSAMPNVDALAKRAVVFEHYFAQGPSTRLSFPSMFASRYDTQIKRHLVGRFPFEIERDNLMLAEVLQDAGYRTVAVLPNDYFLPSRWRGITQGFTVVDSGAVRQSSNAHTAPRVTRQALRHLERHEGAPLFLWVHYFDAHPPHRQPRGIAAHGPRKQDLYAAELSLVDREVGKLLKGVREHLPEALVVLTGDHGIAFDAPRHSRLNYGQDLSTSVLHVPLLIASPYLSPGRVSSLASGLDLAPTLTNAAGIRRKLPFSGYSLFGELTGRTPRPQIVFGQFYIGEEKLRGHDPLRLVSVRSPQYSLVLDRRDGRVQAWRWPADGEERHDIWPGTTPSERKQLSKLRSILDLFVYETYARSAEPG